ncbi:MAG: quinolinate synthase NadA [Candidatus Altiarchaeota archaeon]
MNITEEILKLKEDRNAVILAHNYQIPEIQDLGDFVGDSLDLARKAMNTDADVIVFCGVDFMAETAAILNPEKTVLLPAKTAQCPMAMLLTPEKIRKAREEHPDADVVMYINTHAAAKVYADCVCTSSNAIRIVEAMESETILFAPDRHLASYVQKNTSKKIIPVPDRGLCVVHNNIMLEDVREAREKHPDALLTVHPETPPEVQELADHIGSTNQMIRYVRETDNEEFIIGTEIGIIHRMRKEAPGKKYYPACERAVCRSMKEINLDNLREALDKMQHKVEVPKDIADKTRTAIERMLELSK